MYPYYNETCSPEEFIKTEMQKKSEKAGIRKAALVVALSGAVFFLTSQYLSAIIIYIGGALGVSRDRLAEIFSEPAISNLLEIGLSMLLLTVPFTLFCRAVGRRVSDVAVFSAPRRENRAAYLFIGLGFCAFANIAVYYAGRIFESFGFNSNRSDLPQPEGVFGFLIAIITTAIVPAVVEEYAFRGIVLGLLKPFGEAFAIIASAAAFGILHGNFEQIPFAFLVGLVLGYIRIKSNSLVICVIVHMLNNLVSVLVSYASFMPGGVLTVIYNSYIVLAMAAAVLAVALLKGENRFGFNSPERALGAKETYAAFFFSPAMIIFTAAFIYRAFTYVF